MKKFMNSDKDRGLLFYTLAFYLMFLAIFLYGIFANTSNAPAFIYNNF